MLGGFGSAATRGSKDSRAKAISLLIPQVECNVMECNDTYNAIKCDAMQMKIVFGMYIAHPPQQTEKAIL